MRMKDRRRHSIWRKKTNLAVDLVITLEDMPHVPECDWLPGPHEVFAESLESEFFSYVVVPLEAGKWDVTCGWDETSLPHQCTVSFVPANGMPSGLARITKAMPGILETLNRLSCVKRIEVALTSIENGSVLPAPEWALGCAARLEKVRTAGRKVAHGDMKS